MDLAAQRNAYRDEFLAAEKAVLDSGCYIGGPQVLALEQELANYAGVSHAVACGSGTDALEIALMVLGLEPGDEVIVPDFTFIAPAECVANMGGRVKFADIDRETLQIDPECVEALITPRTKGIIAVNLFGQCAPYTELRSLANEHGLWIIEDSAQAFGAMQNGKRACTFGDIAITSFYPAKPLGCYGDGGAIFTERSDYADAARTIANHGSSKRYLHTQLGMNSRLDAIQAAVLRVKLRHLDEEIQKRQENALAYNKFFENIPGIRNQRVAPGNLSTFAQYTLLIRDRDSFIKKLDAREIPHCIHYPMPLHQQPVFAKSMTATDAASHCPVATEAAQLAISLPFCAFTKTAEIIDKLADIV